MHCMAYMARRENIPWKGTHTHTQAWRVKGAHACCGDDAPGGPREERV